MKPKKAGWLFALGLAVAGVALTFLDELKRQTPIWRYKSHPRKRWDWDAKVRTITEPLMRIVSDGVIAHRSDWMDVTHRREYQGTDIPKDPRTFARNNFFDDILIDTRWGWPTAYALGVNQECEGWRFGYKTEQMEQIRLCQIEIPHDEKVRIAAGDTDVKIFALDRELNELPLNVIGPFLRSDKQYQHLRLL